MASFLRRWGLTVVGILFILAAIASWLFSSLQRLQTSRESAAIAEILKLTPSSRVADVGAGDGRFTVELAREHVRDGYVFATELDIEQLATIGRAVEAAGLSNVTLLESRADSTGLPPSCCDGVVLRRVYHHLTDPSHIAADLFRAVRPGGRLAIIDFPSGAVLPLVAPVAGVPKNRGGHGVPPDIVALELTAVGFLLDARVDDWFGGYCLVFEKPAAPDDA